MVATVYNTLGCNDCPQSTRKSVGQEKIKKDFDAKSVVMNGPRVFLMDSIGQFNAPPPKVNLGGLEIIERAKLDVSLKTVLAGKSKPYVENTINRTTKYVFNKGIMVYLLHYNGDSFIMQSYAMIVNPKYE